MGLKRKIPSEKIKTCFSNEKMFSTEDFIIAVFCCVDDLWHQVTQGQKIRKGGFAPSLSDSEVITMEIVGEFYGLETDKGIWSYFKSHWSDLFPQMKSRTTFVRQASNLWCYKQQLQKLLATNLGGFKTQVHLIDGFPIPLCHYQRANNCRLFIGSANFGDCASKDEKYYGFHGHLVINSFGVITGFCLTGANVSSREALWDVVDGISGLLIGDKGYLSSSLENDLSFYQLNLQTPKRFNMVDERPQSWVRFLLKTRRLVETVIGQLVERFHLAQVRARDLWHFTSRINRKLLAHTVALWLNRHSHNPLAFQQLVSH
jgi:Transposase DDE domain